MSNKQPLGACASKIDLSQSDAYFSRGNLGGQVQFKKKENSHTISSLLNELVSELEVKLPISSTSIEF